MAAALNEKDFLEQAHALWRKAWPKNAPREPQYPHGEVALTEYLRAWAKKQPEHPAVIFYGHVMSYADLDRQSDRFAALIASKGVKKGDRVAVFMPNCPQFRAERYRCRGDRRARPVDRNGQSGEGRDQTARDHRH